MGEPVHGVTTEKVRGSLDGEEVIPRSTKALAEGLKVGRGIQCMTITGLVHKGSLQYFVYDVQDVLAGHGSSSQTLKPWRIKTLVSAPDDEGSIVRLTT